LAGRDAENGLFHGVASGAKSAGVNVNVDPKIIDDVTTPKLMYLYRGN
jgi:hypothetical protein